MKKFFADFATRGLLAAAGGPVVLAIVYGILGAAGVIETLTPGEVCMGVLTVTALAFLVGGMTAIYQLEQLPLASAIAIHGGALYAIYILVYLVNGWLRSQLVPIAIFTGVFLAGYAVIWLCIYLSMRASARSLTQKLNRAE